MTLPRVTGMPRVRVWLQDWEFECCCEPRSIGDELALKVRGGDRMNWEVRHYGFDLQGDETMVDVAGQLVEIHAHRSVYQFLGDRRWRTVGFLPGVSMSSTIAADPDFEWTFEFVIDTGNAPLADSLSTVTAAPDVGSPVHIGLFDDERNAGNEGGVPFWFGFYDVDSPIGERVRIQVSPPFSDAAVAVEWWAQYTQQITVSLGEPSERLWAGREKASRDDRRNFDPLDPRARFAGAQTTQTLHAKQREVAQRSASAASLVADGAEIRRRRKALGLTVDDLAARANLSVEQVASLEQGGSTQEMGLRAWLAVAWALTEPWPELRDRAEALGPQGHLMAGSMSHLERADSIVEQLIDRLDDLN